MLVLASDVYPTTEDWPRHVFECNTLTLNDTLLLKSFIENFFKVIVTRLKENINLV